MSGVGRMMPYETEKYPWLAAYMTHLLAFMLGTILGKMIL